MCVIFTSFTFIQHDSYVSVLQTNVPGYEFGVFKVCISQPRIFQKNKALISKRNALEVRTKGTYMGIAIRPPYVLISLECCKKI